MNTESDKPPGGVLARYPPLADTTVRIHNASGGYVTRAWQIDTGAGSFLLCRLPADATADTAAATAGVHTHAAQAGLAPALVVNDTGELVTTTGGRLFTLTTHLNGATHLFGVPDDALCHHLGHALGRLHQRLREVPADGLRPWQLPGPAAIGDALRAHDRPDCPHLAARRVLQVKLTYAQAITPETRTRLNGLDQQVIHGDVHPGNILLTGERPVFIDFDLARSAPPGYELIRALIYCTHPAGPPEAYRDRVSAFLSGYFSARPLTDPQIATMVELYRAVQILDPYGLHTCENARETLMGFGHARFGLLYWLTRHGAILTDLAHQVRHLTGSRR
ncbi:MAG: phosphotransferase enzyme family protein [Pseudonocardiaceae bacterium]